MKKVYALLPLFLTIVSFPAVADDTSAPRRPPAENTMGAQPTPAPAAPAPELPALPPSPQAQQAPVVLPPVNAPMPPLPAPTQPVAAKASQKQLGGIAHMVSKQVKACWKLPKADRAAAPLTVVIDFDQQGNMSFNQFTTEPTADQQKLADSIKAAIADPACNPIRSLPDAKLYDSWKHVALKFNPKK